MFSNYQVSHGSVSPGTLQAPDDYQASGSGGAMQMPSWSWNSGPGVKGLCGLCILWSLRLFMTVSSGVSSGEDIGCWGHWHKPSSPYKTGWELFSGTSQAHHRAPPWLCLVISSVCDFHGQNLLAQPTGGMCPVWWLVDSNVPLLWTTQAQKNKTATKWASFSSWRYLERGWGRSSVQNCFAYYR